MKFVEEIGEGGPQNRLLKLKIFCYLAGIKRRFLIICIMIAALLACTGSGFASDLPDSPLSGYKHIFFGSISVVVGTYVCEFKDGKLNGYAIWYSQNGSILKEGIWKDDEFLYSKKVTPPVVERDEPQVTIDKVAESYKA